MQTEKLGDLLVGRVRQHKSALDLDILTAFVGVTGNTVESWLSKKSRPNGERLNRLWHFLAAVGIDSPELDRLPPYHRLIGELHAFGVVRLKDDRQDGARDTDLLEILGLKQEQDALRILRGDQTPSRPLLGSVTEVSTLYGMQLDAAKDKWKEEFARALSGKHVRPQATPVPEIGDSSDPAVSAGVSQSSDIADVALTSGLSAALSVPAAPPVTPPSQRDNTPLMLELACKLAAVLPLAHFALSSECSDEDRALMRQLLGRDTLFMLGQALTKLSSTRAYHNNES